METVDAHAGKFFRQWLNLETVDTDHGMTIVHEVVRQREAGRAHADDQHAVAALRTRMRMAHIERIPAREQRIDFEAPWKFEHVLQCARFDLRNVDRLLLLENAGFHTVIANAVAGGRCHRVVDGDDGERRDGVAGGLQGVEFGNFFFQRAASEGHAEWAFLERSIAVQGACAVLRRRFFLQADRAGILALRVAPDAVIGLRQRALEISTLIRQRETFPATDVRGLDDEGGDAIGLVLVFILLRVRNKILRVELGGFFEQYAGVVAIEPGCRVQGPRSIAKCRVDCLFIRGLVFEPRFNMLGIGKLAKGAAEKSGKFEFQRGAIKCRRFLRFVCGHGLALHELALDAVQRRKFVVAIGKCRYFLGNTEKLRNETIQMGCQFEDQCRLVFFRECPRVEAA